MVVSCLGLHGKAEPQSNLTTSGELNGLHRGEGAYLVSLSGEEFVSSGECWLPFWKQVLQAIPLHGLKWLTLAVLAAAGLPAYS